MPTQTSISLFYRTLGSSGAGLLLTIIYSVLSARMLGAEGRGLLAAIQIWPTVLAGAMTMGMSTSFVYHARKNRHLACSFFASGLIATIVLSGLSSVLGTMVLSNFLPTLTAKQINFASIYLTVMLPITAITMYAGGCAQLIDNLRLFNLLKIIPLLLQVISVIVLYLSIGLTPERLAIATVITQFITVVWMINSCIKELGFSISKMWNYFGLLLSYGMSVWAVEIFGILTQQIDKIWISGALSLKYLGLYTLAFGMSRVIANIQNSAAAIIFPRNIGKPMSDVVDSTVQVFRLTFWPTLIFAIPASLLAAPLFPIVFGKDFTLSGQIFPVLVLECIIGTSSWVLAQAFNSLGKPHLIILRQAAGLASTVIVAYLAVPTFSVWGVVMAVLAGSTVRLIVTILAFKKGLGIAIPNIFPNKSDINLITSILKKRLST
jgi:O-antigen/teichoic acid export membrane protein